MQLTLSSESVRNTVMTNETGQVLYKSFHPFKLGKLGTTTIRKIRPNTDPLEQIEWRFYGSSTFRINGQEMQTSDFLPRHGINRTTVETDGWTSYRKRTFTGPDGLPYRWDMLFNVVVVKVARYHRGTLGIIGPKKKPCLEVDPDVMHMLDLIILTFVYVEKLRKDKERAARGNGGGGP
ncbi:hypothetical protein BU15DRAFT_89512 [Melanogaster broomeanus]|nr:hypothetical protein BU15DRAFT_89512 [Melanogaster broomeanus]